MANLIYLRFSLIAKKMLTSVKFLENYNNSRFWGPSAHPQPKIPYVPPTPPPGRRGKGADTISSNLGFVINGLILEHPSTTNKCHITLGCQFHEALSDGVCTSLILILDNGRFMF